MRMGKVLGRVVKLNSELQPDASSPVEKHRRRGANVRTVEGEALGEESRISVKQLQAQLTNDVEVGGVAGQVAEQHVVLDGGLVGGVAVVAIVGVGEDLVVLVAGGGGGVGAAGGAVLDVGGHCAG